MHYVQEYRLINIATPLGPNALLLQGFTGHEAMSQLFRFDLTLLSEQPSVKMDTLIGQKVTISVMNADGSLRYINGHVCRWSQATSDDRFSRFTTEIVPWLWFLTRTTNCRIFQNMSVPDILTKVFTDLGFSDFRNALQGEYEPVEYCVQYRETDFNFVSRLMEEYGIAYFFEHDTSKHTLVMADNISAYKACPQQPKARFEQFTGGTQEEDVINTWHVEQEIRPGSCALKDFNFEMPNTNLLVNVRSNVDENGSGKFEVYDYPGDYRQIAQGEGLVRIRMEEEELPHVAVSGESTCRGFVSGFKFDLTEHSQTEMDGTYLLTGVRHVATMGDSYSGRRGAGVSYSNHFTAIPQKVAFRPLRITPRPTIQGPQTAMVVGPSGEEIWCDKYGRVKVQFHWDRQGKRDENSSCWMRVSQPWGGKGWGGMWIPRIGQEVIVEFLEGDPDRPIITGRVYNAEQMPPYTLPDYSTRSTMKSRSSKGGGMKNFNELRFEDKNGAEQVFLHSERDFDNRAKNDSREWVGNDRSLMIKGNQKESVDGSKHAKVAGDKAEQIDGKMSLKVGGDCHQQIGSLYVVQSGQEIHLTSGTKVVIDAGMELTIKAAGGFIDIGPAGVTIQGIMVNINSGGSAASGSSCSPDTPEQPDVADDGTRGGKMG